MTNYNIKLTPQLINLATEGSQDSSVYNGKSYQRTFNMYEVENIGNRKMINQVKDGEEFNDTTFQNSNGIGTFETGLTFTASQILDSDGMLTINGFIGAGAIIEITPEQSAILNSYGYPSLFFSAIWQDGSENTNAILYVFSINGMETGGVFTDIAGIVPFDEEGNPYCSEPAAWVMPVTTTGFLFGDNNSPGFTERTQDPHIIYKLFKQVAGQQEVDLEGKTPQEKAEIIRSMLENLDDDHPLVFNLRKK
jgi:hypothetical protein